jgi:hypothetical protein
MCTCVCVHEYVRLCVPYPSIAPCLSALLAADYMTRHVEHETGAYVCYRVVSTTVIGLIANNSKQLIK